MKRKQLLSLFLAGAMTAGAASAGAPESSAVIKGVEGQVYVRKDETTEPAQDGLSVAPGNQVMTVEGSKAQVVYTDGCSVSLPENSLLAIGGPEQCRAGQAKVHSTAGFQEKAVSMTPAAFIAWVANTLGVSTTVAAGAVVAGGALVAGGVAYTASELSTESGKSESEISALLSAQGTSQASALSTQGTSQTSARQCNVPSYPPVSGTCTKRKPISGQPTPNIYDCVFTYCDAYGQYQTGSSSGNPLPNCIIN